MIDVGRYRERFQVKWAPVRVKKTRQNKRLEPRSDSIGTEKAPELHDLPSGRKLDIAHLQPGGLSAWLFEKERWPCFDYRASPRRVNPRANATTAA